MRDGDGDEGSTELIGAVVVPGGAQVAENVFRRRNLQPLQLEAIVFWLEQAAPGKVGSRIKFSAALEMYCANHFGSSQNNNISLKIQKCTTTLLQKYTRAILLKSIQIRFCSPSLMVILRKLPFYRSVPPTILFESIQVHFCFFSVATVF